ncbi:MAG: NADH-quinone oxidoreductase subunit C [Anaeromyxobacter sp.]|nr:NADH-quinone oxidoreductase subunit C [Anaeromyxobacter sp.]MBL0276811.1 NADH-quinone oxidoreductase subunit C [Anaeromyxobacter sp.]
MAKVVIDALLERFPRIVTDAYTGPGGDDVVFVRKDQIVEVCRWLKTDPRLAFDMAPYVTAVDYLGQEPRFEVVYNLYSTTLNHRVRLRVKVPEDDAVVPSVTGLWRGADWFERYCFDMYGIRFTGHPDLRRLFMYDEFVGHPLRKDYPLRGRQPLTEERDVPDHFRGPGPAGRD